MAKWEEKVVSVQRVVKVGKGGKKLSLRVVVVVGDKNGKVGVGFGNRGDFLTSLRSGVADAKKNIVKVPLTQVDSIPHITNGRFGAAKVIVRPASFGSGVVAGGASRIVLELAGYKNISCKQLGSDNHINNARALIEALTNFREMETRKKRK